MDQRQFEGEFLLPRDLAHLGHHRSDLGVFLMGIEEGVEHARLVLPSDRRQSRALDDLSARLYLPDDFQFFA